MEVLNENEWRRLKAKYDDFATDVGASVGTVYVRAVVLGYAAEASDSGPIREGARALVEAASFAVQDVSDRFATFERTLSEFRGGFEGSK